MKKTIVLCILDGWGHREDGDANAIALAQTPHWDRLMATCPHTLLEASELNVGLPEGQMGNSEVGHMNIGAGRVILQDLPRIDQALQEGVVSSLPAFKVFIQALKDSQGTCHLMGLFSPGGVHSHERHLKALAQLIEGEGVPVALHAFLDGRDTPPKSAEKYLSSLLDFLKDHPKITLATLGGRYYGMDRDHRWVRVQKAYEAMVEGIPQTQDALAYIHTQYQKGITDEFIPPIALQGYGGMKDEDGLFMGNFRADRARQILKSLSDSSFKGFPRNRVISFASLLGLTAYSEDLSEKMAVLFPSESPRDVLGEVIATHGLHQLRIAETEKYAHVTFFFNGGEEKVYPGEERILVPSPKEVATYDLKPEMSAAQVCEKVLVEIAAEKHDLIILNFANPDMVGHTGNLPAAIQAVEYVDECIGKIAKAIKDQDGVLVICADHGNAEKEIDENGLPHTSHTTNLTPFIVVGEKYKNSKLRAIGKLSDIAPTLLEILDLPIPSLMNGESMFCQLH